MEIKKIAQDKKQNLFVFHIKGTSFRKANILRRYIKDYVPTMAIEDVQITKNSSVLYDEIISHRLGLLPIKTDLSSYNVPEECTCAGEGCAKCTLKMTLSSKGPKTVLADEIKSKDKKVIPAYPKTPIVKLLEGQELEFEATAMLGRGKDHSKWSAAHTYYRGYPTIEIKSKIGLEAIGKKFPKAFTATKTNLKIADPLMITEAVENYCEKNGVIINQMDDEILFFVEPYGQLPIKEIMTTAIEQFNNQLKDFAKLL